jgi:deazaflavin-dependent oxidoreductase (nitroreductase family)
MHGRRQRGQTPWWRARLVRWVLVPVVLLLAFFVMAVRSGSRPLVDVLRQGNKRVLNPVMLRLAGRRHWYAARVEHVGRRSGRSYATPVVAVPLEGGFAIPLPYGTEVDWLHNVQAAGEATVVLDGVRHRVGDPQVVPSEAILPALPPEWAMRTRFYRFSHWLRVTEAT